MIHRNAEIRHPAEHPAQEKETAVQWCGTLSPQNSLENDQIRQYSKEFIDP